MGGESNEQIDTIVIGGGQAGLAIGYQLTRRGVPCLILDASERIGDAWRNRWDSLHLFSPARYDGLDGMAFPAPPASFPSKDDMADYLETYAQRFQLPVRTGVRVDRVSRSGEGFEVRAGALRFEASNVVIAMGSHQRAKVPEFARELDPRIVQLHAGEYRNPSQLVAGDVLVVGAANSGADIAMDVVGSHRTFLAGANPGQLPFPYGTRFTLAVGLRIIRFVGHRVLTVGTPLGRRLRPKLMHRATPLIRHKEPDFARAGIGRVGRVVGARDGLPLLDDGSTREVANIIWCNGYLPSFSFVDLPVFGEDGQPRHRRGVAIGEPGLYFLGLRFLTAMTSETLTGVSRDARYLARCIAGAVPYAGKRPPADATAQPVPVVWL